MEALNVEVVGLPPTWDGAESNTTAPRGAVYTSIATEARISRKDRLKGEFEGLVAKLVF